MTVPGFTGRTIKEAVEYVRNAIADHELAIAVQEAIDEHDNHLGTALD